MRGLASPVKPGKGVPRSWSELTGSLRRAGLYTGPERATLLFSAKAALAATIAWAIAEYLLDANSQQGLLGFWLSPQVWTFAAVALAALLLGHWRHLGSQGSLVATSAFFAYAVFVTQDGSGDRLALLGELVLLVLLGCAIGVIVNVVVLPPMRLRDARYALDNLSSALRDLISDISGVLGEREPTAEEADAFWDRGRNVASLSSQATDAITSARTDVRWNRRRLLLRRLPPFVAYDDLVAQMARATDEPDPEFLRRYAGLLHEACCAIALLVDLDPEDLEPTKRRFQHHLDRARDYYKEPAPQVSSDTGLHLVYGGLLLEAERMLNELVAAYDSLC